MRSFASVPSQSTCALISCISTCVKIVDSLCHICLDDKCQRGCNKGGVCTAVQYECICTKGFYKKGDQCVEGRFPIKMFIC